MSTGRDSRNEFMYGQYNTLLTNLHPNIQREKRKHIKLIITIKQRLNLNCTYLVIPSRVQYWAWVRDRIRHILVLV